MRRIVIIGCATLLISLVSSCQPTNTQSSTPSSTSSPVASQSPAAGTPTPAKRAPEAPTTSFAVSGKLESWSVRIAYVKVDQGTGGMEQVQVDSKGQVLTEHQWMVKKGAQPEQKKAESKAKPESLASIEAALKDPELAKVPPGNSALPWQMTLTANGKSASFFSSDGKFPGAAGRVLQAVEGAAPWPKDFVGKK